MPSWIHIPSYTLGLYHLDNSAVNSGTWPTNLTDQGAVAVSYSTTKKFGTHSLKLDTDAGNSFLLDSAAAMPLCVRNRWTIDYWIKTDLGIGSYATIGTVSVGGCMTGIGRDATGTFTSFGSTDTDYLDFTSFMHLAFVKDNDTQVKIYANGTLAGTYTDSTKYLAGLVIIGFGLLEDCNTYIDEVRLSSEARWTANFTPPTAPYDN